MRTHGQTGTRTYKSWQSMRERCERPAHIGWRLYGGRGIRVCERWISFENFRADMGERPDGCTLDRIDVNGDYSPENCRWATRTEQGRNMRTNRIVIYHGEAMPICAAIERGTVAVGTVHARIRRGWSVDDAIDVRLRTVGLVDLAGNRFGSLTVVSRSQNTKRGNARWVCVCDCGSKITTLSRSLIQGRTKTCGCRNRGQRAAA